MPKIEALEQEPSTGNVFADLGLPGADGHLIKAGLVVRIHRTIRQRKLTQAAAAQLMGIDQSKISAMLAGQFRGYSVERLMRFLVALVVCGKQSNEYALGCGAANRGCSRLSAGDSGREESRTMRKSRLKGGCGQDCPPHRIGRSR
jgi:predicted XRE-type DNA-binding protein